MLGLWQGSIAALNFFDGGAHKFIAQAMLATLMGGAIHHHAVGEKAPGASVGALVFLGLSVAVPVLAGKDATQTAGIALALAGLGFGMGQVLRGMATKKQHTK